MAEFKGFRCDNCGAVHPVEERTRVTVKIDGPEVQGEYVMEYGPDCARNSVPEGVELRPLRRRRGQSQADDSVRPASNNNDSDGASLSSQDTPHAE